MPSMGCLFTNKFAVQIVKQVMPPPSHSHPPPSLFLPFFFVSYRAKFVSLSLSPSLYFLAATGPFLTQLFFPFTHSLPYLPSLFSSSPLSPSFPVMFIPPLLFSPLSLPPSLPLPLPLSPSSLPPPSLLPPLSLLLPASSLP